MITYNENLMGKMTIKQAQRCSSTLSSSIPSSATMPKLYPYGLCGLWGCYVPMFNNQNLEL